MRMQTGPYWNRQPVGRWEELQLARERRRENLERLETQQRELASQFNRIQQTHAAGMGDLFARMASQRISKSA